MNTYDNDSLYDEYTPDEPFGEGVLAIELCDLSDTELKEFGARAMPHANLSDLRFCQAHYKNAKVTPTFGELALIDALIAERGASHSGYVLSHFATDDPTVAETYRDMREKLAYTYPDRKYPPTLEDIARLSGDYMRMIGRDASEMSGERDPLGRLENPMTLKTEDSEELIHLFGAQNFEKLMFPTEAAFVLLTPAEGESGEIGYKENVERLLADERVSPLKPYTLRVGRFGIIETLTACTKGIFADLSKLPIGDGESFTLSRLATEHIGRSLLVSTRQKAMYICTFANELGLCATYFAKSTDTGRWRASGELTQSLDIPFSFINSMIYGRADGRFMCEAEDFRSAARRITLFVNGESRLSEGSMIRTARRLVAPVCLSTEHSPFSAAACAVLESVMKLVSRGADRKNVGAYLAYSLSDRARTEIERGRALAAVLGAYRACIELALPLSAPEMRSTSLAPSVTCCAYTPLFSRELPDKFRGGNTTLAYMTFGRSPEGIPDFASFRAMCDRFSELCGKGQVISARALTGSLASAISYMSQGKALTLSADADAYMNVYCQGILLELPAEADTYGMLRFGIIGD